MYINFHQICLLFSTGCPQEIDFESCIFVAGSYVFSNRKSITKSDTKK